MPGLSLGSRLNISTYLPRMERKRRWQYSWPIGFTPRWYTHPENSHVPLSSPKTEDPPDSDRSLPDCLNDAVSIKMKYLKSEGNGTEVKGDREGRRSSRQKLRCYCWSPLLIFQIWTVFACIPYSLRNSGKQQKYEIIIMKNVIWRRNLWYEIYNFICFITCEILLICWISQLFLN